MGKAALHWAAQFGEARLLHELLRSAADINAADGAGNTALHLAALNNHLCAHPCHRFVTSKYASKPCSIPKRVTIGEL